jgi:hypothetical protein
VECIYLSSIVEGAVRQNKAKLLVLPNQEKNKAEQMNNEQQLKCLITEDDQ